MAGVLEYSTTPASNTTVNGIGIAGSNSVKNGDDALRQLMADTASAITKVVDKTGTYTALKTDFNQMIRATGTLTLNLTAAATLTAGWCIWVKGDGGAVTVDPNSSEQINGATTLALADGFSAFIVCTGTAFRAVVLSNGDVTLTGTQTLANKTLTSPVINTPTINNATFTGIDPWAFQPIGVPIPVQKNITGVSAPPTDQAYRYILLTAGETGSGKYNNGVLGSESVTGSAPLVQATATVTLSGSPVNGQSVRLINTERRFLRAGSTGTVENDQMQQITGEIRSGMHAAAAIGMLNTPSGAISNVPSINNAYPSPAAASTIPDGISFDSANSPNARTGTETRAKNIGVEYYMRIK